jgi:hypothetical protein
MIKWNDNKKNKKNNNNFKKNELNSCKDKIVDGRWCKTMIENLKQENKTILTDKIWEPGELLIQMVWLIIQLIYSMIEIHKATD